MSWQPGDAEQETMLFARWDALDTAMGPQWGRPSAQWWPEDADPDRAEPSARSNIFVLKQFNPNVQNQKDAVDPDKSLWTLWQEEKSGKRTYDHSHFIALIKDAGPNRFEDLFGDLPRSDAFVSRLQRLFADHRVGAESMLIPDRSETMYWYVCPLQRNAAPIAQLLGLAKADIAQKAAFLRRHRKVDEADRLGRLKFQTGEREDTEYGPAAEAMEVFEDLLRYGEARDWPNWMYCLNEACYGVAANFALQDWLMLTWNHAEFLPSDTKPGLLSRLGLAKSAPVFDLEPSYGLWKAGGEYKLDGDTCYVSEVKRR